MLDRRLPLPTPSATLWVVLGCGVLCGAAVAANRAAPEPPAAATAARAPAASRSALARLEAAAAPGPAAPAPLAPAGVAPEIPVAAAPPPTRAAAAPPRDEAPLPEPRQGFAMLLALAALVVAGGAVAVHLKGRSEGRGPERRPLEVVASLRLGGRWPVSLVRVPGRLLVLGATDKGLTLLAEVDPDDEPGLLTQGLDDEYEEAAPPRRPWRAELPDDGDDDDDIAYARLPRRSRPRTVPMAGPPTAPREVRGATGTDDAFLDHLLDRLESAQPAVIRAAAAPVEHERDALRRRVQQARRGPTRI